MGYKNGFLLASVLTTSPFSLLNQMGLGGLVNPLLSQVFGIINSTGLPI